MEVNTRLPRFFKYHSLHIFVEEKKNSMGVFYISMRPNNSFSLEYMVVFVFVKYIRCFSVAIL